MPSRIDPSKPADRGPARKSDVRTNLAVAKAELEHGGFVRRLAAAVERSADDRLRDLQVSALDFVTSQADRDAIRKGEYTGDLTPVLHAALDQIQAAGGGVLHLPQGLYPCNIILGREGGRTNVHLEGEARGTTRLRSYQPGGFAIADIVTDEAPWGYAPPVTGRRSLRNLSFVGDGRSGCGLLIASKAGTETTNLLTYDCRIGIMVVDTHYGLHVRPMARDCDIGLWFGTVSGRLTGPEVMLPPELNGRFGHAGNQMLLEPAVHGNRIGMVALGHEPGNTPMLAIRGGACEGNKIGLFVPDAPAETVAKQERNAVVALTIEELWFEANGDDQLGATTETVNGWIGRRGDLHLGAGVVEMRGGGMARVTVTAGGALYGDRVWYNTPSHASFFDAPFGAALFDRAVGEAGEPGTWGPIIRRPMPYREKYAASAFVPPKGAFGRHPNIVAADSCDGPTLARGFTRFGNEELFRFGVEDGPLAERCWAMNAPDGGLTGVKLMHPFRTGKVYLLLVVAKPVGIDAVLTVVGGQAVMQANKWLPANRWSFVALVSVAAEIGDEEPILGLNNHSGAAIELRLGGLALLEFDRKEEAAEACAGELFPAR